MTVYTEGITNLRLLPTNRPGGWQVRFDSPHADCCHQLYANGQLVDWTDSTSERAFDITAIETPAELCILAVAPETRSSEYTSALPADSANPPWIHTLRIPRDLAYRPGDRVEVFRDDTTGAWESTPVVRREYWPSSIEHWGFGLCSWGSGGFGVDGETAPGMGTGEFGVGPFGFGGDSLRFDVPLPESRTCNIKLQTRSHEGGLSSPELLAVRSYPPPKPATSITALRYDTYAQQLILQITQEIL